MIYRSENYLQITQELKNNPSCLQLTLPLSVNPNIWDNHFYWLYREQDTFGSGKK